MMEGIRDDLCSKDSLNELVPKVINMKRMTIKRLSNPRVKIFENFFKNINAKSAVTFTKTATKTPSIMTLSRRMLSRMSIDRMMFSRMTAVE